MTMKIILFYFLLIIFGIAVLLIALSHKKKLERSREILAESGQRKGEENVDKNKTKQQIELELLLINNNPFLKILAVLDKNIRVKLLVTLLLSGLYYLYAVKNDSNFVIGLSIILVFIIVIPGILTNAILKAKVKKIMVDLPGFIDLVAVNVQTGISIDAALKQVAIDFKKLNPDLLM